MVSTPSIVIHGTLLSHRPFPLSPVGGVATPYLDCCNSIGFLSVELLKLRQPFTVQQYRPDDVAVGFRS